MRSLHLSHLKMAPQAKTLLRDAVPPHDGLCEARILDLIYRPSDLLRRSTLNDSVML
jgi:hypothetical protein